MDEDRDVKITEKSFLSLHLVAILIGFAVWLIKMNDKVDQQEKIIEGLQLAEKEWSKLVWENDRRTYRLEIKVGLKHKDE